MNDAIQRVRYFPRQYLQARDFQTEQDYHLSMRRRHNIAHHGWGIVQGLEVRLDLQSESTAHPELFVEAGMAVDGYGREIVLPARQPISGQSFDELDSDLLDVWILYGRRRVDTAEGASICSSSNDDDRWEEQPRIELTPFDPAQVDRRHPQRVDPADRNFSPERPPPEDPARFWPVFLGMLRRVDRDGAASVEIDPAGRPYAKLYGERIEAPSGRAAVQLGADDDTDTYRFSVAVEQPAEARSPCASPVVQPERARLAETLAIEPNGRIHCYGDVDVHGDLRLEQGSLHFALAGSEPSPGQVMEERPKVTGDARPRMYHWQGVDTNLAAEKKKKDANPPPVDNAGAQGAAEDANDGLRQTADEPLSEPLSEPFAHELRIVIPRSPDGASPGNAVVIGAWSEDEKQFIPGLVVTETGRVEIHGDLVIGGELIETRRRIQPALSPEAHSALQTAVTSGIAAVTPDNLKGAVLSVAAVLADESGVKLVVNIMLGKEEYTANFIKALSDPPLIAKALKALFADPDAMKALLDVLGDASSQPLRDQLVNALHQSANGAANLLGSLLLAVANTSVDNT